MCKSNYPEPKTCGGAHVIHSITAPAAARLPTDLLMAQVLRVEINSHSVQAQNLSRLDWHGEESGRFSAGIKPVASNPAVIVDGLRSVKSPTCTGRIQER